MDTSFRPDKLGKYGYHFGKLDKRLQLRFWQLVSEHSHSVNRAISGLSALPGVAQAYAAVRAQSRFLRHDEQDLPFPALIEPAQDTIRQALTSCRRGIALLLHDWSMFAFNTHTSKTDRYQRSHDQDLGYDLGTALVVETDTGRPLGPMELRLRTANGMLSTRLGPTTFPPGHVDELLEVMEAAKTWNLGKDLVHVIDREADSVGHYRQWHAAGHRFVVRADTQRVVQFRGQECSLADVVASLRCQFRDVTTADGQPEVVTIRAGVGRVRVAEAAVVLHRPAKHNTGERTAGGHKRKVEVAGEPIALRLVVTQVVAANGKVLAEWWLLTNVPAAQADAATIGQWYAWRWQIEPYHKLLKSAGMNAEEWQQTNGTAFLRRLCVASQACLAVWHLQRDPSPEAEALRGVLVRLSGRQMKHRVKSTAPALLAGLEKLLALEDLLATADLQATFALARRMLPQMFRSGP